MSGSEKSESWWARLAQPTGQERAEERRPAAQDRPERLRARNEEQQGGRSNAGGGRCGHEAPHPLLAFTNALVCQNPSRTIVGRFPVEGRTEIGRNPDGGH
jgi:hypothetical protein